MTLQDDPLPLLRAWATSGCCCELHACAGIEGPMPDGHGRVGFERDIICPACPQHGRPAPDIEALAAAAHQAWLKEKQAQGWADHPIAAVGYDAISTMGLRASTGCVKCGRTLGRHHPNMVPYAALSEADKDLDRKMVLTVLRAMGCLMAPDCPECERMLRAYAAEEWTTRAAVTAYIAYRAHRATHEVEQEEPKDHGR